MVFINKSILRKSLFILFLDSLLFLQPSVLSSTYISNSETKLINNGIVNTYSSDKIKVNDFTKNDPLLKTYGPLILDINNINYAAGILIIPMLNNDYKPLFLAINCSQSIFNIKGNNTWNTWFKPFFTYELNILNDLCGN